MKMVEPTEQEELQRMSEKLNLQVDEDLFLFCLNLYSAAASMSMPVENPPQKKIEIEDMGVFAFKDLPLNRGMLAVSQENGFLAIQAGVALVSS